MSMLTDVTYVPSMLVRSNGLSRACGGAMLAWNHSLLTLPITSGIALLSSRSSVLCQPCAWR
jgi:hypothetical protein